MTITEVKVHPVDQDKLKAYVSIVLDNCFLVSDIKVISGPAGLFVSMPSKRKKTGEFKDIAHPLNRETRQWMADRILQEYEKALASIAANPPAPSQAPVADGGEGGGEGEDEKGEQ
jgi:stage V sporulation protein G